MQQIYLTSVFLLLFLVGCSPINQQEIVMVSDVKYIAKYHYNETVVASQNDEWESLPFNIYIDEESTQGYVLNETTNKSFVIDGFTGIVRVQGCLHPYNNNIGVVEATIWARVLVNGDEKRCLQASKTKSFRTEGVDILPFTGTISVKDGDVIELQWRVSNQDIILLTPDPVFDKPVSHSINFERMK